MTPERWQQIKAIFDQAAERGPASRAEFLRESCGHDEELRREVESLLASDAEEASLLETSVMGAGAAAASPVASPAQQDSFGPYVPIRALGEGGMGTVYLARQEQPIRREVALKVVKLGMDSRQVLERFEIERQALALMEYPNVARVLDAGTSKLGRPYFVMEYVDGVPITQYCNQKALSTRERLQLFIPVCNAIQHAHKKGIIHRDVKPSNVLVMEVDGKPVPKVIDFGIARATDQRAAEREGFTLAGQIIGTPEYMSPEQAGLGSRDIDTGTDVYSLGVVLYELLVGALPLDMRELRKIAFGEVMRAIRETPVPRPTARITQMGAAAEAMARQRGTDAGQLKRDLSGDLDWIVMKAIDKDRQCRYGSASDFAADIERYLKSEPVLAGPPGAAYRMRKFVTRHKRPVAAAAAVMIALVAGIVTTAWQARVAGQQRTAAVGGRAEAEKQRTRAEQQGIEAANQRDAAEAASKRANQSSRLALARQLTAEASQLAQASTTNNSLSALLNIESMLRQPSLQNSQQLNRLLGMMPKQVLSIDHGGAGVLQFSHDGKRIAMGCDDNTVRVFETTTGKEIWRLAPGGLVSSLIFSPNDHWVATASDDKTARVFEAASGRPISRLVHNGPVSSLSFSADGRWVATASADNTARVFEAATGNEISRLTHDGPVSSVAFSPDGRLVASQGKDDIARVFEASTGKETSRADVRASDLTSNAQPDDSSFRLVGLVAVAFSSDGRRVVAARRSRPKPSWAVFEAATGREVSHHDDPGVKALSPDGRWVATAIGTNAFPSSLVQVLDADTGNEVSRLAHDDRVFAMTFSPDGHWVATASVDKTVRVFEAATGREVADLPSDAQQVAFSPDGRWLATASRLLSGAHSARVFEMVVGKGMAPLEEDGSLHDKALSPNGRWVATGSDHEFARVFDVATGKQIARLKHEEPVMKVALSPDGRWIATAPLFTPVRVLEVATGNEVSRLSDVEPHTLLFSPDGRWIVTASADGMARVFEAATGRKVSDFGLGEFGSGYALAFSPNGRWIADQLGVFEFASGRVISHVSSALPGVVFTSSPKSHFSWPRESNPGLAFSPNNQLVARGNIRNTARVFEAATGKELLSLAHQGNVSAVAFSPDGLWLATGSDDKTARVFEVASGREIFRFLHRGFVVAVAFSPDGRSLFSASAPTSRDIPAGMGLWLDRQFLNADDLIDETCSRLTSNLTHAQWEQYLGDEPYHNTCPKLTPGDELSRRATGIRK